MTEINENNNPSPFPLGAPNDAYAQYFTGRSYLAPLGGDDKVKVSNVTFEAGCINHWHVHHGAAQILLAVGGTGYYQIEGQEPRRLSPGDVAVIPADTKHWHGASPTESFAHIAVMAANASTDWLDPVDQAQYGKLR
ncbi:cupin domain-containing protein [Bifidobacterium bombi]|uniref:Cupin domain protein n=1 Tax=Bifidobacterium bombi DSM 19703 TaxID=1341695 RepID=A0A080N2T9_9BIFI|nr:cupin domain-containing protein [Bifidobacterium bombi]KFF31337.1 cupin domain protein [Bifidobacterium bombi DSM 19703]